MKQARREGKRMRLYVGVIWIGDKPGTRLSVWAENPKAAREQVEAEYGKGHVMSLYNEEDAARTRQGGVLIKKMRKRSEPGAAARPELHGLYQEALQVEIAGNVPGLLLIAEALESEQQGRIALTAPADIGQWDGWLMEVEVQPVEGRKVRVDRTASKLVFIGDPSGLAILATTMRSLASGELGSHTHEEYYSGHPFFDETTMPMVVTLLD